MLGAVSKTNSCDTPNSARILKVMDKMLKIGGSECSSPNLHGKKSGFIKVKGLSGGQYGGNLSTVISGIIQTGNQSKLKKMMSERKAKKSRGGEKEILGKHAYT